MLVIQVQVQQADHGHNTTLKNIVKNLLSGDEV